jgi:hypothetical protein
MCDMYIEQRQSLFIRDTHSSQRVSTMTVRVQTQNKGSDREPQGDLLQDDLSAVNLQS